MISFAAQRLMDLGVEGLCGAGFGESSDDRTNHRNGYRDQRWETRADVRGVAFHQNLLSYRQSHRRMTALVERKTI
jgi:hypothetical protein